MLLYRVGLSERTSHSPEAVKKFRIPCRERSPQRSPLPWGTDFKWLGTSTRNGTASVPYEAPIFSQLPEWVGPPTFGCTTADPSHPYRLRQTASRESGAKPPRSKRASERPDNKADAPIR